MPQDNDDEIRFWNRRGGSQWRDNQAHFDTLFTDVTSQLLARAAVEAGESVLDVGCGNGDTTVQLASAVGPTGRVTGVDVSVPLLEAATARISALELAQVQLLEADAQTASFDQLVDAVVSRFGVMFFADPVAAFANLRRHTRTGGRLAIAAWGELEDNPWFAWPFDTATAVLGAVPARNPRKPGPTAFGDPDPVLDTLARAGWHDARVHSEAVWLQVDGDARRTAALAAELGPVARVYKTHPPTAEQKADIVTSLAHRFRTGEHAGGTRVPARILFFTAYNAA